MNKGNIFYRLGGVVLFILAFSALMSCGDGKTLSESTAINAVDAYLKSNPIYETVGLQIGEVKFKLKKDQSKLDAYKELEKEGYLDLDLAKQKKKFLSKDSILAYYVKLTDKARPFIFKQKKETVEVKSFEFQLDEKEQAKIEVSGKKSGKVVVTLKKVNTVFSVLANDKNPNTPFITKTFLLSYKKDNGWMVTKSK